MPSSPYRICILLAVYPIQMVFGLNKQLVNGIGGRYGCDIHEHNHWDSPIISVGRRNFIQIQHKNVGVKFHKELDQLAYQKQQQLVNLSLGPARCKTLTS